MVGSPELNGREFHLDLDPVKDGFSLERHEGGDALGVVGDGDGDGGLDARDGEEVGVEDEDEGGDKIEGQVDGEEEEGQYPAVVGGVSS